MFIYNTCQLSRMLKRDIISYLVDVLQYKKPLSNDKQDLITCIKKSPLYDYHIHFYNTILSEKIDLSIEQYSIYKSIIFFMMGVVNEDLYTNVLNNFFISDISSIVLSNFNYIDYPEDKNNIILLKGGAGTGKTHLISIILSKCIQLSKYVFENYPELYSGMEIQVIAPTNKAVKVIKNKIERVVKQYNYNINYSTISKFLQQDIEYTESGDIIYKTNINIKNSGYKNIKYIIIDEVSMVSRKNWIELKTYIFSKIPNVKIILIGDEFQLPPVNEQESVVFNLSCKKYNLQKIKRSDSKHIRNIYKYYRKSVINKVNIDYSEINGECCRPIHSFKDVITKYFDINHDKIISYSNDSVTKYNKMVRNIIFNNPPSPYVISEKMIFGSSIRCFNMNNISMDSRYSFYANDEMTIYSSEKITISINKFYCIDKYDIKYIFPEQTFDVYKLNMSFSDIKSSNMYTIYKLDEKNINEFSLYFQSCYERIKEESSKKNIRRKTISLLWDIFYSIKNTIDIPIHYSYALTVYKSQGSTFRKIFIDIEDIHCCVKNKNILYKTLYTAITRASHKIFYYKPVYNDYCRLDLEKYSFLEKHTIVDKERARYVLKDKQPIIYTRNEYQSKKRKLIRCNIVHILNNKIMVSNNDYIWELILNDDIIIYV